MTEEPIWLFTQRCEIGEVMLNTLSSQHFADICETAALAANLAKHNAARLPFTARACTPGCSDIDALCIGSAYERRP